MSTDKNDEHVCGPTCDEDIDPHIDREAMRRLWALREGEAVKLIRVRSAHGVYLCLPTEPSAPPLDGGSYRTRPLAPADADTDDVGDAAAMATKIARRDDGMVYWSQLLAGVIVIIVLLAIGWAVLALVLR